MAYNLLDLRTRVRTKIKDTAYPSGTIDGFINDAIQEIAGLYIWKWLATLKTTDTLTIGNNTFDNPSDLESLQRFVLVDPLEPTRYWDITKCRKDNDFFFSVWANAGELTPGLPAAWTEYGDRIYLNCPADRAYKVHQHYQCIPAYLESDGDVPVYPVTFREAIVLGASYRCEEERDNYDIAGVLQNRFNDRVSDLITRYANDTLAGPDTVIMPGKRRYDD